MATSKKIKVEENRSLERDSFSKAILNSDSSAYHCVRNRKKLLKAQEQTILNLQADVKALLEWQTKIDRMLSKKDDK